MAALFKVFFNYVWDGKVEELSRTSNASATAAADDAEEAIGKVRKRELEWEPDGEEEDPAKLTDITVHSVEYVQEIDVA